MIKQAHKLLALLAFAVPTLAQTQAQETPAANTEKLMKIETAGLGG
jgi:hypothetical protein